MFILFFWVVQDAVKERTPVRTPYFYLLALKASALPTLQVNQTQSDIPLNVNLLPHISIIIITHLYPHLIMNANAFHSLFLDFMISQ